jgi:hypothetical protein
MQQVAGLVMGDLGDTYLTKQKYVLNIPTAHMTQRHGAAAVYLSHLGVRTKVAVQAGRILLFKP